MVTSRDSRRLRENRYRFPEGVVPPRFTHAPNVPVVDRIRQFWSSMSEPISPTIASVALAAPRSIDQTGPEMGHAPPPRDRSGLPARHRALNSGHDTEIVVLVLPLGNRHGATSDTNCPGTILERRGANLNQAGCGPRVPIGADITTAARWRAGRMAWARPRWMAVAAYPGLFTKREVPHAGASLFWRCRANSPSSTWQHGIP
jgi:hypothetical protein